MILTFSIRLVIAILDFCTCTFGYTFLLGEWVLIGFWPHADALHGWANLLPSPLIQCRSFGFLGLVKLKERFFTQYPGVLVL